MLLLAVSAGAPVFTAHDPLAQSAAERFAAPGVTHALGRDAFGRDVFARVLYAGRISLSVGLGSVALGGLLGTALGVVAGYADRRVDAVLMRIVDVSMSFPSLLLGLIVLVVLGPGLDKLVLSIGIVLASPFARVVHGATLGLKQREFVEAARCLGAARMRILACHILPNMTSELLVLAGVSIAAAVRIEASLSFIGQGVSPPTPTWGNMIRDGVPDLLIAPWLVIAPGVAILVCVVAFNLLTDGLQEYLLHGRR